VLGRFVAVHLIAPVNPAGDALAAEQFAIRAGAALLDQAIDGVGLFGMLLFPADENVHLAPAGRERTDAAANAEQQQLGYIAEIKTHSAPIWPAVLAHFVPDQVRLVMEAPSFHYP
jgi:hypothetical protein